MARNKIDIMTDNIVKVGHEEISDLIYLIRGKQVMVDSDLAVLYQVETKVFNQAVKRNIKRFPEQFMFQLTTKEFEILRSQFVTSSSWGGRRSRPYVFTESGIAMLSAILHSEVAIDVSIRIMSAFTEMRRFIASNAKMFEKIESIGKKQLEYKRETDNKFNEVFEYIYDHEEDSQKIFFEGQIFDAFDQITKIIKIAKSDIILIDSYVDTGTLDILSKKHAKVKVDIYTLEHSNRLTQQDIECFQKQYPTLGIHFTEEFHDRFLILDHTIGYHVGASIKDAGKKCFAITKLEDRKNIQDILNRL